MLAKTNSDSKKRMMKIDRLGVKKTQTYRTNIFLRFPYCYHTINNPDMTCLGYRLKRPSQPSLEVAERQPAY